MRSFYKPMGCGFLIVGFLAAVLVSAQQEDSPATFPHAMHSSMKQMNDDMASAPMTGDADQDFAAMMIPHHQGAIEMAKVELRYGVDPVMRRLAQKILVDQKSEIDAMQLWTSKRAAAKMKWER